ncbi:MAG: indole-3-glycerol-phosphate synthase [Myxococcota bacterium]
MTEPAPEGVLGAIVARTRRELPRRRRRAATLALPSPVAALRRREATSEALRRRRDGKPRVIAEVKFRSPSAGEIRPRRAGEAPRVARGYVAGGAAAVSVLADGPAFGGSPLDVRRVAAAVPVPVLFKGFVLDEVQLDLAARMGARLVLLLVRALSRETLERLVRGAEARGLLPVVEAADESELRVALATGAAVVGVNARDLRTFEVDAALARRCLEATPRSRIAVYMSGVRSREDLHAVASGRADAVLIGEGLMRAPAPGKRLAGWLAIK